MRKLISKLTSPVTRNLVLVTFFVALFASAYASAPSEFISENADPIQLYEAISRDLVTPMPSYEAFSLALKGFQSLKKQQAGIQKDVLTIIDFSKSSNEKRLWIIDLQTQKILINDWVAHGKNSGNKFASVFSNTPNSNTSSLGFYITGKTYSGKHGLSLFLNGMDEGYNDNARKRAIVLHGADYVSAEFIKKYGRLGRSFGCPSVSMAIYKQVIDTIRDGSCLFIYYPDQDFLNKSSVLHPIFPKFTADLKEITEAGS